MSLNEAPCHCLVIDGSGFIRFCNKALQTNLGHSESDLLGTNIETIFPVASKLFYQTHLLPLLRLSGEASEAFLALEDRNRKTVPIVWDISSSIIEEETLFVFSGMLQVRREIYERGLIAAKKSAEDALASDPLRIEAKLQAARYKSEMENQIRLNDQKTFDLVQFNRVLGHDIREPVRKIMMFAGMFSSEQKSSTIYSEEQLREKIKNSAEMLSQLADDLQILADFEHNKPEFSQVMLKEGVEAGIARVSSSHPNWKFSVKVNGDGKVWADKAEIQFLFYLLIVNAIQKQKADEVSLSVHIDQINQPEIGFDGKTNQFKLTSRIKFGGIDSNYRRHSSKYFQDLFKQLKAGSPETFQLSLIKKIIERNGGSVSTEIHAERGVTFMLLLPVKSV